MSAVGKKISSKQWNIPMLNARKHMQDKDTRGDSSFGYGIIKLQNIYERLHLDRIEESLGYMAYKTEAGSQHKAQYDKQVHEMQITTLYKWESLWEMVNISLKKEYEVLTQRHGRTTRESRTKGGLSTWVPNGKMSSN